MVGHGPGYAAAVFASHGHRRPRRRWPQPPPSLPWRGTLTLIVVGILLVGPPLTSTASAQEITRPFEEEIWNEDPANVDQVEAELGLVDLRTLDLSRTSLETNGYAGRGLRVAIPTGGFRGFGPLDRLGPFDQADQAPDDVWFRYHIRLIDWNAASSGKLPGLAGLYSSSARGCIPSSETRPGWSARGMFDAPGTHGAAPGRVPIGTYLYHVDQTGDCGDGLWWDASLEQGRWYCVEGRVKMNTPGENDGLLRGWLDGKLRLSRNDIQYRRAGEVDVGVRHMWHNVYFGGQWSTPNPLSLEYDEVVVSTDGRVGCLRAFTDTGTTIHTKSIRELHALGYLYGCAYRKACPERLLTRGEAAALISRILDLPASTSDHFTDDDGSTFEEVINRLADSGISTGCDPPANTSFCPDRTMTRAEFATMLSIGLDLTGSPPDVFTDDDGQWAEEYINRFAASGITDGCGADRFCPERELPRAEAAAFFYRSLSLLAPLGQASTTSPPNWPPAGEPPSIAPEEQD